jgi:glycosyltransferase involved in cell wall biosynthesis
MKVSIIVPTFNRANFITRAITSIVNQTYKDLEIIVIDDGSTDDTKSIVKSLSKETNVPIKYYRKENGGCASARNKGLEYSNGEFIAFLDSDDEWVPSALETLLSKIIQSHADFVYSPAIEVSENGREKINYPIAAGSPDELSVKHFQFPNLRNGSLLFSKNVFSIAGGMDENLKYDEDSDFFQRVAIRCKGAYSEKPTVRHYHHKGNKSKNRAEIYKALLYSAEKILQENPNFAVNIGKIADERIAQIKNDLFCDLICKGEFTKAAALVKEKNMSIGIGAKLSLSWESTIPMRITKFINKLKKRVFALSKFHLSIPKI